MISTILDHIKDMDPAIRRLCERIFHINVATGYTDPPATMYEWIEQQFGTLDSVREQTVVKITNRFTLEGSIFNPVRALRPSDQTGNDQALEQRIRAELAHRDHFRTPLSDTTADLFGRVRGQHCITASNVAKCDGWHGLVLFDEPHPLHFGRDQLCDYLDVAFRWIEAVHMRDDEAIYPIIFWHCLPKGSATQMHGHMQLAVGKGMHYARIEQWRRVATAYRAEYGVNYFDDLVKVHAALGLQLPTIEATRSFVHLTPLRQREVVLLADMPPHPTRDHQSLIQPPSGFADMLYQVIRGLIEEQGMRTFNVAIAPPPLAQIDDDWCDVPLIARIGDRGDPLTTRGDIGALELYAMGCIVVDPFDVAPVLQRYIQPPGTVG
ncbi:MAG: hypothetical protein GFH27_549311n102 [Chloroflexi bacterium AL-W]|nr:hypothetical protein [Chloroflexi bacterium AL-N1]NOK68720.1 hypothetical protein [Chloroflexi bacterium AL-N10]NOK76206.1 hypothetical protein [Chloroflexi bacterium AL-N5]NOK84157.1 hypothetical protein [Chloroflexi bacterium AL-W]NOK91344.1 hypothetical protein [Chloroflexi bacterium AL-N15]